MKMEYRKNSLTARLLSVGEVADFLGVHPSTVRRWGKKGLLKSYAIGLGNNLRFKQEDILNFLHKYQQGGTHWVSLDSGLSKGGTKAIREGDGKMRDVRGRAGCEAEGNSARTRTAVKAYSTWYEFKKDFEKKLGHSLLNWDWMELKPKAPLPWTGSHMKAALLAVARFQTGRRRHKSCSRKLALGGKS